MDSILALARICAWAMVAGVALLWLSFWLAFFSWVWRKP